MSIFSRKKTMTTLDVGVFLSDLYLQTVTFELDEAMKKGEEKISDDDGSEIFTYDRKKHVEENLYMYAFLVYNEIKRYFPKKSDIIIKNFNDNLKKNGKGFVLEAVSEYEKAWDGNDNSKKSDNLSSNPIYRVSKLATTRKFKGEDVKFPYIIMFTESFNYFSKVLYENLKNIKVIG